MAIEENVGFSEIIRTHYSDFRKFIYEINGLKYFGRRFFQSVVSNSLNENIRT